MLKKYKRSIFAAFALLSLICLAEEPEENLYPPELAGYRMFYGPRSGVYTNIIDFTNLSSMSMQVFPQAPVYFYFAAFDTDGNLSLEQSPEYFYLRTCIIMWQPEKTNIAIRFKEIKELGSYWAVAWGSSKRIVLRD